jgi:Phage integrase family
MEEPVDQLEVGAESLPGNALAIASQESLVTSAKAGMHLAYAELCRRHSIRTLHVVQRITRNKEDAEDALQESLGTAYTRENGTRRKAAATACPASCRAVCMRSAAVRAGVLAEGDKRRFGWHNFRHSLASFLVASGTDTKTVQELLRHSKVQTTLDLYSLSMPVERMVAQGSMLNTIFSQNPPAEKLITGAPRV